MFEFPAVLAGEEIRISASTFVAYSKCAELADARIGGEYGPETTVAFRGGLAHRLFSRHLSVGPIAPDEFVQICREEIGSSHLNHKMAALGLRRSDLERVFEEVRALYVRFAKMPTEGFVGSELELLAEPQPGLELVGTIDAVFEDEGEVRLVDWKTGALGEADVQLGFYSLLWVLARDTLPDATEAISVRTGERSHFEPTLKDVGAIANTVAAMVTDLRSSWRDSRALIRTGGPWCRGCARLQDCSEGQTAVKVAARSEGP